MKFVAGTFLAALICCPAAAITDGEFDIDDQYPSDGALIVDKAERGRPDLGYSPMCSGVLIHSKVFLTAAHCVSGSIYFSEEGYPLDRPLPERYAEAPPVPNWHSPGVWVTFNNDPADLHPKEAKCETCLAIERAILSPYYKPSKSTTANPGDLAVVILKEKYNQATPVDLPPLGYFDDLQASKLLKGSTIINVGFGQRFNETTIPKNDRESLYRREFSTSTVKSLGPEFIGLHMQANKGNGGTCYGDSGGSGYYTDESGHLVLAGLTIWGDVNCISTDRRARLDIKDSVSFLTCILDEADGAEDYDNCN